MERVRWRCTCTYLVAPMDIKVPESRPDVVVGLWRASGGREDGQPRAVLVALGMMDDGMPRLREAPRAPAKFSQTTASAHASVTPPARFHAQT